MTQTNHIEYESKRKGKPMGGLWMLLLVVGIWVLLQAVILPKLGIST